MLSLCACGAKPQPTPTAAPTAVPTEVPAEKPAEAAPEESGAADTGSDEDTFDPNSSGSVLRYYGARGEEMYGSYAFAQLDSEGRKTWTAPLAGIKEFIVPEAFQEAKGGIRASGGEELYIGTGIVSMDIFYLPYTEAKYQEFIKQISEFAKNHPDPTEEDKVNYTAMVREYNENAYHLFGIMGIGNNGTLDELKSVLRERFKALDLTDEDIDLMFAAGEFLEAGSAEDYNFFLIKHRNNSVDFTEEQAGYVDEYTALYDNAASFIPNFTFMRPLALAELVTEGTGLEFETKDLNGAVVNSKDLFSGHKVTMLNIWETTCSSCMTEMPQLKQMAAAFEANGGQLVGLVYDAMEDDLIQEAKEIAADLELNFVNLLPTQEMRDFFKVQAFPTTYFFNEKGEVIGEPIVGANIEQYAPTMNGYLGK